MFSLALSIVGERADAEEIVTDVFMRVWNAPSSFDPERGSVGAFLNIMTRSRALDRVRSLGRRSGAEERAAHQHPEGLAAPISRGSASPDEEAARSETKSTLEEALSNLPENQRVAIAMAYFEGFSQSEIAERTVTPLGTIKTRIRTGMASLRELLGAQKAGSGR